MVSLQRRIEVAVQMACFPLRDRQGARVRGVEHDRRTRHRRFLETALQRGHAGFDAELRRFPSCLWRDSDPDNAGSDEVLIEQVFWLRGHPTNSALPSSRTDSGLKLGAFVARYSGATARVSHPFPYSPRAIARGTLQGLTLLHVVP